MRKRVNSWTPVWHVVIFPCCVISDRKKSCDPAFYQGSTWKVRSEMSRVARSVHISHYIYFANIAFSIKELQLILSLQHKKTAHKNKSHTTHMSHETQTFAWKENRISELSTKMPFPWFVYVYLSFFSSYLLIFPLSCNEMFHYLREGKKVTLQRWGRRHPTKSENYEITMHTPTTLIIKQRQFQFRPCTQLQASKTDSKSLLKPNGKHLANWLLI